MPNTREKLIEVKQTLEMCYKQGITSECNGCAYRGHNNVCMDALMEDALAVINQLESNAPVQKWIPVTERLPTEDDADGDGFVFAYTVENKKIIALWTDVCKFSEFVTHWMPLPPAPKGE